MPPRYDSFPDEPTDDLSETGLVRAESGLPAPRLWRSRSNRVVAGVIGGLSEKFGLEALPVRILYGALTVASAGLLAIPYAAIWAITRVHGPSRSGARFWRRSSNKVIAGVLGGLSDKLGVPATVTRVLYAMATVFTMGAPGAVLYLLLWALMPSIDDAGEPARYREDFDR
jgi:phage shock protein PspC (stress-responsive transcriptional regulator)